MKKNIPLLLLAVFFCTGIFAQVVEVPQIAAEEVKVYTPPAPVQELKEYMRLQMPGDTGKKNGTRGAAVAWVPTAKKYYASFAGNTKYPMAVFDEKGKRISKDDLVTQFDTRGLWYDAKKKKLMANGYGENGWISYMLDAKGIPTDFVQVVGYKSQPEDHSVGAGDAAGTGVYFYGYDYVTKYTPNGKWSSEKYLNKGYAMAADDGNTSVTTEDNVGKVDQEAIKEPEIIAPPAVTTTTDAAVSSFDSRYNTTTIVYTGINEMELGLLNVAKKQVELYSKKSGYMTKILKLPAEAPTELVFNFAYANGVVWLFDKTKRLWVGYK